MRGHLAIDLLASMSAGSSKHSASSDDGFMNYGGKSVTQQHSGDNGPIIQFGKEEGTLIN